MIGDPITSSRPRAALVSFAFPELCAALANGLAEHVDVDLTLVLPASLSTTAAATLRPEIPLTSLLSPRLRSPLRQAAMLIRVLRRLRALDPDVVHLQHGHLWFNLALPLLRKPLVVTVHDATPHLGDARSHATPQRILEFGWRQARRLIVQTRSVRTELTDRGFDPGTVDLVPHPPIGPRHRQDPPGEVPVVLFFGRIWPYKGLEHLIRCEPLLRRAIEDVRIVIAGEGEDFGRYEAMMSEPDRFEVHNRYLSDDERDDLFRRASVVVLPYVEASQSGVVTLAYAHGRPVVVTDVGGLPEAVEPGETGLVVPARDEAALADAIGMILRDPELRARMGAAARAKLDGEASVSVVGRATAEVYRRAISGSR